MNENEILDSNVDLTIDSEPVELINQNKFLILYFLSFGLYGIWWMYKCWKFFKEKDVLDIMPAGRAFFAILFSYQLFEKIQDYAKANGYLKSYSSTGLFVLFLALNLLSRLPEPYWLISFLAVIALIQPFLAFNFAIENSDHYHPVYKQGYNSRQIAILIIGGILSILVIIGLFVETGFLGLEETY